MTDQKLGNLLNAIADFYWVIPLKDVRQKIMAWHPEKTEKQIKRVLRKCNDNLYLYHCCPVSEGLPEPALVERGDGSPF